MRTTGTLGCVKSHTSWVLWRFWNEGIRRVWPQAATQGAFPKRSKILVRSIPDGLRGLAHNVNLIGANRHRLPCYSQPQWRQYAFEVLCLRDS